MVRTRPLRLLLWTALGIGASVLVALRHRAASRVTFSRDIAPIGFKHCAPCHRPGQSAPFDLLTFEDYRAHAADVAWAVEDRYMPPWKPAARDGSLIGDRSLSDAQVQLMLRWVREGTAEGDRRDLPTQPTWPRGFQLGPPDAVAHMEPAYEVGPDGPDEYRNFVIPSPFAEPVYIDGWEFLPGTRAIHHAILRVDRLGNAQRADAADPAPGFAAMQFEDAQAPDGFYLVWAPGKTPMRVTDGTAWLLEPGTPLVLELHMQRTGKRETIAPQIALYRASAPPRLKRYSLRIGDPPIDIAPGRKDYTIADSIQLPAAVQVLGLFPHAHYLARRMRVWSRFPDGAGRELLRIDDWDFNWQDEYSFVDPPRLPKGSTLQMEFVYDNSVANVRNPNHPPRRVTGGMQSTDEMGNVTLQLRPEAPADMDRLLESKYREQLARGAGTQAHYNLANTLVRLGEPTAAVEQYRAALALRPDLAPAQFNLANTLCGQRQWNAALPHIRAAIALTPRDLQARALLADTLLRLGEVAHAIVELEAALSIGPQDVTLHSLLGDALRKQGQREPARVHYRAALERRPNFPPALRGLAALGAAEQEPSVVDRAADRR